MRSCNDFFCRHISALPFSNANTSYVLNQMTGLLKCVAIELKITAANNQVTQFGHMCKILLGVVQGTAAHHSLDTTTTAAAASDYSLLHSTFGGTMRMDSLTTGARSADRSTVAAGLLICKLLECLQFDIKPVERPKFDFFDNQLMQQLLHNCDVPATTANGGGGPKFINIKRLDSILRGELTIVQTTIASGQMALILREKEAVLKYALAINVQRNICSSTVKFLESWGQVTEILFSVAPTFAIVHDVRQGLIIEILQSLLGKVVSFEIMPELASLASSTALQLLVTLRHCYQKGGSGISSNGDSTLLSLTNTIRATYSPRTNSLSLKYILKDIVEWILISGAASQKLKCNLYTAMLNLLHIIKGTTAKRHELEAAVTEPTYVSRLDKSMAVMMDRRGDDEDHSNQTKMAVEVVSAVGDKLIDILCHDCTGGHDVCKMLALSCIDMLLEMDPMVSFIQFISRRGYLAHIIDSLMKTDQQLCRVLDVQPEHMKALYVYEPKMAMLGRIASSHIGAHLLLEHKALGVLSQMRVFDMHPDFQVINFILCPSLSFNNTLFIDKSICGRSTSGSVFFIYSTG